MNYIIYMHKNKINGKVYIGQTCQTPIKRWGYNGSGYKCSPIFYSAIKKYGWENFEHVIIEDNITTQAAANEREVYWISFFHSYIKGPFCNGYNATLGGSDHIYTGISVLQLDFNKNILNTFLSFKAATTFIHTSSSSIQRACKNGGGYRLGYYWCTVDQYLQFDPSKIDFKNQPILQLDSTKKIIQEYESITAASLILGGSSKRGISAAIKDHSLCNGFYWCYKRNFESFEPRLSCQVRQVCCLDLDNNFIRLFSSVKDAAQSINKQGSQISACCRGKCKSIGGYRWKYLEDYQNENR